MHAEISPSGVAGPAANYALAVTSTDPTRWLHTSGIVAVRPDGSVPGGLDAQVDTIWTTLGALLSEAGMAPTDVVSVCTYVVPGQDLGVVMAGRDRFFGDHRAASTLLLVAGLVQPQWLLEISLVACARG